MGAAMEKPSNCTAKLPVTLKGPSKALHDSPATKAPVVSPTEKIAEM